MKKILLVIGVLVISILFSHPIAAKQTVSEVDAQIIQTFCNQDILYAYVNIPYEKQTKTLIADALIDKTYSYQQSEPMERVVSGKETVSYLFLIDISTSMPRFKENVTTFVSSVFSSAGDNASFAIATFGKELEFDGEFTKDQSKLNKRLSELQYNVKQTSLYTSIIGAINYLENRQRTEGELYNLVIVTDGIEADQNGVTKEEVKEKILSSSVLIHTFGFPSKSSDEDEKKESEEALKILGSFSRYSLGVYSVLGYDNKTEADNAKEITDYVNNLYRISFDITHFNGVEGEYDYRIIFATTGENGTLFDASGTVKIPGSKSSVLPAISGGSGTDSVGEQTEDNKEAVDNESGSKSGDLTEEVQEVSVISKLSNIRFEGIKIWLIFLIVPISLLLLVVMLVILHRRRKVKNASSQSGIYMKIILLSDKCNVSRTEFYLNQELIIGRGKKCDLQIKNKGISKENSRLFVNENAIYLEDLNSTNGTSINGMKIHSPNKLRSEDVITIGPVKSLFKF